MSRKRPAPEDCGERSLDMSTVYLSPPINDRSSTFVAAFSAVVPYRALQTIPAFTDATHRIAAWRKPSKQQRIDQNSKRTYDMGHDDDGESYAGKKIERLLESMDAEGSAVVARWYGGVLLGPIRFTHIETCARRAIFACQEASRHAVSAIVVDSEQKKRQKLDEEDSSTRIALLNRLAERDQSIVVLRKLLAETASKPAHKASTQENLPSSPTKSPSHKSTGLASDYSRMSSETLNRLEHARDRTIAFLLKKIDQAEASNREANTSTHEKVEEPASRTTPLQQTSSQAHRVEAESDVGLGHED